MSRPWGYKVKKISDSRDMVISSMALKTMNADERAIWDKSHHILHEVDQDGKRILSPEEIGKENKRIMEALNAPAEKSEPEKTDDEKPKKKKDGKEK